MSPRGLALGSGPPRSSSVRSTTPPMAASPLTTGVSAVGGVLVLDIVTGESDADATDAESSVLANDPTFTSCLRDH
jgi:hypothetical protein